MWSKATESTTRPRSFSGLASGRKLPLRATWRAPSIALVMRGLERSPSRDCAAVSGAQQARIAAKDTEASPSFPIMGPLLRNVFDLATENADKSAVAVIAGQDDRGNHPKGQF